MNVKEYIKKKYRIFEWTPEEIDAFAAYRKSGKHKFCDTDFDDRLGCTCRKQTPLDDYVGGFRRGFLVALTSRR